MSFAAMHVITPWLMPTGEPACEDGKDAEAEEERKAKLMEKAMALKANYERKLKLRARFDEYVQQEGATGAAAGGKFGTDYTKWDMWCPEDEEDDMINSITPNSPAFRAMEKDIDERHNRCAWHRMAACVHCCACVAGIPAWVTPMHACAHCPCVVMSPVPTRCARALPVRNKHSPTCQLNTHTAAAQDG